MPYWMLNIIVAGLFLYTTYIIMKMIQKNREDDDDDDY